jgi:putative ABC transport system permease protein
MGPGTDALTITRVLPSNPHMLSDLRLGLRQVMRRPGLSLAAILSLALGIGANTAIFSVLHHVVLNALPYRDPDRLVMVWETRADNAERWVAPANFVDWRRDTTAFESMAAFDDFSPTLSNLGEPERVHALSASGTFFTTLGATSAMGRTLLAEDDRADADGVAVLSDGFWRRAFGGSRDAIGRTLILDGRPHTVVGIMPDGFDTPLLRDIDLWLNGDRGVPRTFPFGGDVTAVRDSHVIFVVGRLAPEASREVAQDQLSALMLDLSRRYPDTNAGLGVNVKPLHDQITGGVRSLLQLLQLAVGMMLLIACANVAHLLLGQAAGRSGEMTTRAALGAGRARLVRQMLAETLVLAVPGGLLGLAIAAGSLNALVAAAPDGLPRASEIRLDPIVLGFTIALTVTTAIVFGLGPAIQLARQGSLSTASSTLRLAGSRQVRRWHHAIVVTELVLAQMLLVGAGLLLASFLASQRVPLGFESVGRTAADLSLAPDRYLQPVAEGAFQIDPTRKIAFVNTVLDVLRSSPGVRAAAASFTSPLTGAPNRGISLDRQAPKAPGQEDTADFQLVTPEYFRTLGVPLVQGRTFTNLDTANSPQVTVVNQAFVNAYLRGEDPIGRQVRFGARASHEIVGVVADMRYRRVESPADPTFYLPITQNAERWPFLSITVWQDGDPGTAVTLMRRAIQQADPAQALTRVRTFDDILRTSLAARRFNTILVAAFAAVALFLAAIGAYGVMAYAVSVRTRELGVRAALGASPYELRRMLLAQGARLTAGAVAIGAIAALAASGLLRAMLYGVTPRDPAIFVGVAIVLALVALVATALPSRRATRINPIQALRE